MARKQAARKFVEYWTFRRGSEKGEDQQFWNSLLRDVLGVADVECHIQFQVPVPMAAGRGRPALPIRQMVGRGLWTRRIAPPSPPPLRRFLTPVQNILALHWRRCMATCRKVPFRARSRAFLRLGRGFDRPEIRLKSAGECVVIMRSMGSGTPGELNCGASHRQGSHRNGEESLAKPQRRMTSVQYDARKTSFREIPRKPLQMCKVAGTHDRTGLDLYSQRCIV